VPHWVAEHEALNSRLAFLPAELAGVLTIQPELKEALTRLKLHTLRGARMPAVSFNTAALWNQSPRSRR